MRQDKNKLQVGDTLYSVNEFNYKVYEYKIASIFLERDHGYYSVVFRLKYKVNDKICTNVFPFYIVNQMFDTREQADHESERLKLFDNTSKSLHRTYCINDITPTE